MIDQFCRQATPEEIAAYRHQLYPLQDIVFEVGGKGKGRSQFKGMDAKIKIIFADGYDMNNMRRPLFLAGLLNG